MCHPNPRYQASQQACPIQHGIKTQHSLLRRASLIQGSHLFPAREVVLHLVQANDRLKDTKRLLSHSWSQAVCFDAWGETRLNLLLLALCPASLGFAHQLLAFIKCTPATIQADMGAYCKPLIYRTQPETIRTACKECTLDSETTLI